MSTIELFLINWASTIIIFIVTIVKSQLLTALRELSSNLSYKHEKSQEILEISWNLEISRNLEILWNLGISKSRTRFWLDFGQLQTPWRRWPSGKWLLINGIGNNPASSTVAKRSAFMIPVNIAIFVAPFFDIPPQMCILAGCLALCVRTRGWCCFLKQIRLSMAIKLDCTLIRKYDMELDKSPPLARWGWWGLQLIGSLLACKVWGALKLCSL